MVRADRHAGEPWIVAGDAGRGRQADFFKRRRELLGLGGGDGGEAGGVVDERRAAGVGDAGRDLEAVLRIGLERFERLEDDRVAGAGGVDVCRNRPAVAGADEPHGVRPLRRQRMRIDAAALADQTDIRGDEGIERHVALKIPRPGAHNRRPKPCTPDRPAG